MTKTRRVEQTGSHRHGCDGPASLFGKPFPVIPTVLFLMTSFPRSLSPPPSIPAPSLVMGKATKILENLMKPFIRHQHRGPESEEEALEKIAARDHSKVFSYETLVAATRNFSLKNKVGEGGFGPVYKGQLKDGRPIAVKVLGRGSRQGVREFANEVMLLSRVQHKNVVNLYGYCVHADEKFLVYEYVANESLDKFLFSREGQKVEAEVLDWRQRYEVMVGIARGLLYLHEDAPTPIIHRDIKANNILLDERWCPKIADFGISRLFPEDLTYVNTGLVGTKGYMAPEYVLHGTLSTKVDVFSFGVLLIELISGQKNSSFTPFLEASSLIESASKLHMKKQTMDLVDPALRPTADAEQVAMCVHLGLLCTQTDPRLRPDITRVLVILSKKPGILKEPFSPWLHGSSHGRSHGRLHGGRHTTGKSTSSSASSSTSASVLDPNDTETAYLSTSSVISAAATASRPPLPHTI